MTVKERLNGWPRLIMVGLALLVVLSGGAKLYVDSAVNAHDGSVAAHPGVAESLKTTNQEVKDRLKCLEKQSVRLQLVIVNLAAKQGLDIDPSDLETEP
jgi:hypothetical protein